MSFFNLEILKGKLEKFEGIMPNWKLFKNYAFGTKKLKSKQKLQFMWTSENMVKF
jgi:hypothetical protein